MEMLFYPLWFLALGKVLFSPGLRIVMKGLSVGVIGIGIWIVIGAVVYQTEYAKFLIQKHEFEIKKETFLASQKKLESVLSEHTSARDVLLQLAMIAYQTNDHEKLQQYLKTLQRIDPNNTRVKQFIDTTQ